MTANQPQSSRPILEAAKLAFVDDVTAALEATEDAYNELRACDSRGHTPLHLLAAHSKDTCIELLLKKAGDDSKNLIALQDSEGNTPLHLGAHFPMACYQLAAEAPSVCLVKNKAGLTPIDLARQHGSGEALNALLLACSGNPSPDVIDPMKELTKMGAVADTWAPNGQSSLMLAAAANSPKAITLLLSSGASLELQDAMGRTALMWAAGSGAVDALKVLLDTGASVALRDRRNRTACDYAEKPEAKKVLEARVKELETKATAAQEALLAELLEEEERKAASKATKKAKKRAKAKEKKASKNTKDDVIEVEKEGKSTSTTPAATNDEDNNESAATAVVVAEEEIEAEAGQATAIEGEGAQTSSASQRITTTTTTTASASLPSSSKPTAAPSSPLAAHSAAVIRPPSPDWCTVGATKKEKQPQQLPLKSGVHAQQQTHHHGHAHSQQHPHPHHHQQHRRSPSVGSVTSVSSGTSHETDGSKQSGSERSVLRRAVAAGAIGNSVAAAAQFAIPRPPVPVQKQAKCTRSTSGGEEVGAAALFGASDATTTTTTTATATAGGGIKPGSWASVAASQRSGSSNGASASTTAGGGGGAGVLVAGAPVSEKQPQPQQPHATLASAIVRGAWASTTGTNSLTTPSGGSSIDGSHSNFTLNQLITATATTAPAAPTTTATTSASAAAFQQAAAEEIAALRAEIHRLKLKNAAAELAHHQELVAVLQDASQHENAAVAKATSDERLACTVRFASLLQNNGVALAGVIPGLLAGAGITTANDLDVFLNNNNLSSNSGIGNGVAGATSSNNNTGRAGGGGASGVSTSRNINILSPSHMAAQTFNNNNNNNNGTSSSGGGIAATDAISPLSTSPFSYEVGEHLRGDFFGNHSAFMVPAVETHAITAAAASPPQGASPGVDVFMASNRSNNTATAAAAAAAWGPIGSGTSSASAWGSSIR